MKDLEKRFNEFRNDGEHCSIDDSNLNIYDVAMLLAFIQSELSRQKQELLQDYSDWLNKKGYIDSDYYTEEPKAIDAFLSSYNHNSKI